MIKHNNETKNVQQFSSFLDLNCVVLFILVVCFVLFIRWFLDEHIIIACSCLFRFTFMWNNAAMAIYIFASVVFLFLCILIVLLFAWPENYYLFEFHFIDTNLGWQLHCSMTSSCLNPLSVVVLSYWFKIVASKWCRWKQCQETMGECPRQRALFTHLFAHMLSDLKHSFHCIFSVFFLYLSFSFLNSY